MPNGDGNDKSINPRSLVSLGLVITVIGATWRLSTTLSDADAKREAGFSKIEAALTVKASDRWTGRDQILWAAELQRDNPNLKVPEPFPGK